MSGAEVIAVLGIISSVIAIVDGTKQLYDAASSAAGLPEAFREVSGRLPIVRGILQCAEQHIRDSPTSNQSCLAMKPLIDACEEKAKCLELIFQKVIPGDDASRLERYFRAARTLGKGGRVETLMEGLLKDVLLLASEHGMRAATSRQVGELENAIKDLSTLEPSIPDAVFEEAAFMNNNFGNGPMTNYNIAGDQKSQVNYGPGKQFQAETQTFHMGDEHIYQQAYHGPVQQFNFRSAAPTQGRLQRICEDGVLDQLKFERMDERYEDIDEAHEKTFRWIYESQVHGFMDWLKSGNGVFWITGKPGSGKSTLMKFISQDPRTDENLPRDFDNRLISRFFFNDKGGDPLVKSQEGLFRAILYTILSEYRQLICIALPERYKRWKRNAYLHSHDSSMSKWTIKELGAGLRAIVSQSQWRFHLCLLIDGLDEFSGAPGVIIQTLAELIRDSADSQVRVQLCLSSRPLGDFEDAYLQHTHLRVQDLTKGDIKAYVNSKFNEDRVLSKLLTEDPTTTELIIEEILQKAEGVFLWVKLVVGTLVESLTNGDNMKTLQSRLSVLPAGLIPLYKSMVEKIDPFYHKVTGRVFQLVQFAALPLSPLAMSFAEDDPRTAISHELLFSDNDIEKRHSNVARQLRARTAGLIEISAVRHRDHNRVGSSKSNLLSEDEHSPWKQSQIQYMHLTVKEFLISGDTPRWLADEIATIDNVHLTVAACCLRQIRATESLDLYDYRARINRNAFAAYAEATLTGIIFMIMFHLRQAERDTHKSQWPYLESLNVFLMGQHSDRYSVSEDSHWTAHRYSDWSEPAGWLSDFVSYLVTLRMSQSVIDAFNHGYNPAAKSGRPLLLYATCKLIPSYAIGELEINEEIDLLMVKALLDRGCDPNESFDSLHRGDVRDYGKRTVWESVLVFSCINPKRHYVARPKDEDLRKDQAHHRSVRHQWLQVIELFLHYGAEPNQCVVTSESGGRRSSCRYAHRVSALTAFIQEFADPDEDLVASIRCSLVSKGAVKFDESWTQDKSNGIPNSFDFDPLVAKPERNWRFLPFLRKEHAARHGGTRSHSGNQKWGCCIQS